MGELTQFFELFAAEAFAHASRHPGVALGAAGVLVGLGLIARLRRSRTQVACATPPPPLATVDRDVDEVLASLSRDMRKPLVRGDTQPASPLPDAAPVSFPAIVASLPDLSRPSRFVPPDPDDFAPTNAAVKPFDVAASASLDPSDFAPTNVVPPRRHSCPPPVPADARPAPARRRTHARRLAQGTAPAKPTDVTVCETPQRHRGLGALFDVPTALYPAECPVVMSELKRRLRAKS